MALAAFVQDKNGKWHYRVVDQDGNVVESEGYDTREECVEAYLNEQ